MRRSSFAALSALCFAMVSGLWLAAAAADTPDAEAADTPPIPTQPAATAAAIESPLGDDEEPAIRLNGNGEALLGLKEPPKVDLDFPLYSSRRTWGWNRFVGQSSTEPALFEAEDPQPLFRVTGSKPAGNIATEEAFASPEALLSNDNFTLDNWGIHPATPVPTPVPDSDVLIDKRVVPAAAVEAKEEASSEKPTTELKQGEAAKVILELMDTLGRSVLDGTVFEKPSEIDAQWLKDLDASQATPREALIQYIRALEAQEEHARGQADVINASSEPAAEEEIVSISAEEIEIGCPDARAAELDYVRSDVEPGEVDDQQAEIDSLRDASEELEQLANRLERQDNYFRADQVRELAGQLRFDARRVQSPEMAEMIPHGAPLPMNAPFAMGNMLPPQQFPFMPSATPFSAPLPAYGPMLPSGPSPAMAPPGMGPTPQPTFEPSTNVKQLEAEVQMLREELRKSRGPRTVRGDSSLR